MFLTDFYVNHLDDSLLTRIICWLYLSLCNGREVLSEIELNYSKSGDAWFLPNERNTILLFMDIIIMCNEIRQ